MNELLHDLNVFVIGAAVGWVAYPLWTALSRIWKNAKKTTDKEK